MPIPLVVGPNMNIHEDQRHRLTLVSYSAVCKHIITQRVERADSLGMAGGLG